ncbi:hypothetical protein [Agrobacterium sp. OT33]|uniref:hypothetical protein n=1 Tax=Agrobacterium sp. OT33 TaxID=2815338 RepID=UPI001A8E13EB|nr:hypothetical protein [Agrobacterium sp. OT33]MBO0125100.1 hypothetical protein [Agrobacterium sp. OT33]
MSELDIERFRKVHALMTGGATAGERSAAKARAEAMAKKAGLTLDEALHRADVAQTNAKTHWADDNYWNAFWQFAQENLRKENERKQKAEEERRAAYWAEQERKAQARFEDAERKFGPADIAFAETERERLLRETLEPIALRKNFSNGEEYIYGFGDWTGRAPSRSVTDMLNHAYKLPRDILGAWQEHRDWDQLFDRRYAYYNDYDNPIHVLCRLAALEAILDTSPVRCWGDLDLRIAWQRLKLERWYSIDEQTEFIQRLEVDLEILRDLDITRYLKTKKTIRPKRQRTTISERQGDLFAP